MRSEGCVKEGGRKADLFYAIFSRKKTANNQAQNGVFEANLYLLFFMGQFAGAQKDINTRIRPTLPFANHA